jgi:predicted nucleic acid-binding protein
VVGVHFQTERLGWHTDDFLIECDSAGTGTRKLVGQVKRSFTVSAADDDCRKAIGDFWDDFSNADTFRAEHDRLILVTQRGTNTLLEHFVGLVECARAARDAAEFQARLATRGFISEKSVHYCGELERIITEHEAKPITAADLWPFLRVLYLLSLDLQTSTRQTEAHMRSLLAYTVMEADAIGGAAASWNALLSLASSAISEARSVRRDEMPEDLKHRHNLLATNEHRILHAAKEHSDLILRGIRPVLGLGLHLARAALVQQVLSELETSQVVLVSGPAGSGKSVIGKGVVGLLSNDHFTFGFRAEEFAQPHLDATLNTAQIPANGITLAAILAAQDRKVVVVESVERLLEKSTRDAFADLMTLVSSDRGLRVVLTCRDYSIDQVRASFLQSTGIGHAVVTVPPLGDVTSGTLRALSPIVNG